MSRFAYSCVAKDARWTVYIPNHFFSAPTDPPCRLSALYIILLSVVNSGLTVYYAWISSNESQYEPGDWQQCILYGIASQSTGYNTQFPLSASASGLQVLTFSLLSLVTTYRALCHPDWLQSTIGE